jgi:resuscitation-promoting factor RpfE
MTVLATALAVLAFDAGPPPEPLGLTIRTPYVSVIPCRACRERRRWRRVVRPYRAHLLAIASCESGRRWHIATGNGFYGGLQFTPSSWWSVGGRGMPHNASALEQMFRAVLLSRTQGWGAWPVCG